jgi:hypothetical protein
MNFNIYLTFFVLVLNVIAMLYDFHNLNVRKMGGCIVHNIPLINNLCNAGEKCLYSCQALYTPNIHFSVTTAWIFLTVMPSTLCEKSN